MDSSEIIDTNNFEFYIYHFVEQQIATVCVYPKNTDPDFFSCLLLVVFIVVSLSKISSHATKRLSVSRCLYKCDIYIIVTTIYFGF